MKKSVWTDMVQLPRFKSLKGDKRCDVLVIGGGLCGILCAYYLKNKGVDCILVEAETLAGGITKNTTGKITSQHGLVYSNLALSYGKEIAQMYLNANEAALKEYKRLAENIECDFEEKAAYTYSLKSRALIEDEVHCVESLGGECDFCEKTELPLDIKGAIRFGHQAQFNPLKFVLGLSEGLEIYENTFVYAIDKGVALTKGGNIQADKIIVCTHFPFINKHGAYFLKLYQHRSYVSAFENMPPFEGMYVDEDLKGISLRSYGRVTIIGGGGHRTGKEGRAWQEINAFAKKHYPLAKLKYEWAALSPI